MYHFRVTPADLARDANTEQRVTKILQQVIAAHGTSRKSNQNDDFQRIMMKPKIGTKQRVLRHK